MLQLHLALGNQFRFSDITELIANLHTDKKVGIFSQTHPYLTEKDVYESYTQVKCVKRLPS